MAVERAVLDSSIRQKVAGEGVWNEEIFGKLMADGEFRKLALEHLLHKVYKTLKGF